MPDAVIYSRFSPRPEKSGDQELKARAEDAATIQQQIDACRRYCDMKSFTVTQVIRDPETSARHTKLFERPGGSALLELPPGTHIVAAKLDRLFRNTIDGLSSMSTLRRNGLTLHLADQGGCTIDTNTAIGELITTMLLSVAAFEPRQTAERVSKGMRYRQNTLRQRMSANVPFGFRLCPDTNLLIDDEHERQLMKRCHALRKQGFSLREIIAILIRDGDEKCRGKQWHPNTIQRLIEAHEKHLVPAGAASA